jgi:hypothetical protein
MELKIKNGEIMEKRILNRSRIRTVHDSFAFIPHRFLTDGFMKRLGPGELLLYLFLVLVSDAYGLSYYGDSSISRLLKMGVSDLKSLRQVLMDEDLIVYEAPLYQVLELPLKPLPGEIHIDGLPCSATSFSQLIRRLED